LDNPGWFQLAVLFVELGHLPGTRDWVKDISLEDTVECVTPSVAKHFGNVTDIFNSHNGLGSGDGTAGLYWVRSGYCQTSYHVQGSPHPIVIMLRQKSWPRTLALAVPFHWETCPLRWDVTEAIHDHPP
jgi:hypothetical protein